MDARGVTAFRACGAALFAVLALNGCDRTTSRDKEAKGAVVVLDEDVVPSDVMTVDAPVGIDPALGATPMAQRVAVIGLLNKRNGLARDVTLKPGEGVRLGDVVIRVRACERTAPWEPEQVTGAFVQLDVRQRDGHWRRPFSGWLFKERPALNIAQHPIYDVWTKSCAMSFPVGGPDSTAVTGPVPARGAPATSRAKKSPAPAAPAAPAPEPTAPSIAAVSNAT